MGKNDTVIHPNAIVHPQAQLDTGVHVGPYSIIGPQVIVHKNTCLDAHVYIDGLTSIGEDCHFFPYSAVGTDPQDIGYKKEETKVIIGSRNIFREFMTVNRGTKKEGGLTQIGNDSYFMAYSHIAHDCHVGNHIVFMNGVTLAGHCIVDDYAQISAFTGVHQFCRIGKYAYIGGYSVITQDVLPFCKLAGARPPLIFGPNSLGLRRLGFSRDRIKAIKAMFKLIFHSNLNTQQALEKITADFPPNEDRDEILDFLGSSKRGIVKKVSEEWQEE